MRMSPLGKESRPYSIKDGDVIQLGVDYKGKTEDLYKSVIVKLFVTYDEGTAAKRGGSPRQYVPKIEFLPLGSTLKINCSQLSIETSVSILH